MLHLLYWSNIKRFWQNSLLQFNERNAFLTKLKWLIELIFFIPNIIIVPIIWTIVDFCTKKPPSHPPSTDVEPIPQNNKNEKNNHKECSQPLIQSVLPSLDPIELGRNLFCALRAIDARDYQGEHLDFNVAVKDISERYLIIYNDGCFSFVTNDHAAISVPALQEAIKKLWQLGRESVLAQSSEHSSRFQYAHDIYKYIMKPFGHSALNYLNKKNVNDNIVDSITKIQAQYRDWIFPARAGINRPIYDENQSAMLIQRGYRKYQYIKNRSLLDASFSFEERYRDEIEDYKAYHVRLNQPVPQKQRTIDKKAQETWVNLHTDSMKSAAKNFAASIVYRSWTKTEHRLRYSVKGFNETLMSYANADRAYIIVVPDTKGTKSNHFMTSIALKYLVKKPTKIISFNEIANYLQNKPDIKNYLFVDDASYSGRQLEEFLSKNHPLLPPNATIHLVIPFMRNEVHFNIYRFYPKIMVHRHEAMLSMSRLNKLGFFSSDEYNKIVHIVEKYPCANSVSKRTLYYFDHTIADEVSTFTSVFEDGRLLDDSFVHVNFVAKSDFSYKSNKYLNAD